MAQPDLTEFFTLQSNSTCKTANVLAQLSGQEKANFEAALASELLKPGALVKWAAKRDLILTTTAVVNHRSKTCSCGKA